MLYSFIQLHKRNLSRNTTALSQSLAEIISLVEVLKVTVCLALVRRPGGLAFALSVQFFL